MAGDFALYYDAIDGNRYPVPNAVWTNLSIAAEGQANNLSVLWPNNPAPQIAGEFILVFKGTMGSEQTGVSSVGVANNSIGAVTTRRILLGCRALSISIASDPPTTVSTVLTPGINQSNYKIDYAYHRTGTVIGNGSKELVFPIQSGTPGDTNIYQGHITYVNAKESPFVSTSLAGFVAPLPAGSGYFVLTGMISYEAIGNAGFNPVGGSAVWTELPGSLDLGGNQTVISLSEGTQLAAFPYSVLDSNGHKANYPIDLTWLGNSWLDLYTDTKDGNGNWAPVFSQRVTFTVPPGVCTP